MIDQTPDRDDDGPDAFVIIHHPTDGTDPYGVGPFPPSDELVSMVLAGIRCDCKTEVLWLAFPRGLKMAIGVDMEEVMAMAAEAVSVKPDLLN